MKPVILGLAGSLRNKAPDNLAETISRLKTHQEFMSFIEIAARDQALSNSEGYLASALFGAKDLADIDYVSLSKHFPRKGKPRKINDLLKRVAEADGIIISSPVYFGDKSSLIQDFFDVLRKASIDFSKKVLGACAVGAKRNGGQETTLVYTLFDAMEKGFLITGNGPPTAQYGGTGVAGDIGAMREDFNGIETSISTGIKVSQTTKIIQEGLKELKRKKALSMRTKVCFMVLADRDDLLKNNISELLKEADTSNLAVKILDMTQYKFNKCNACHICPGIKDTSLDYRCIFRDDDMARLHEEILSYDAILTCSFAPKNTKGLETTYQKFLERTRYFRRDNFKLTNRLIAGFAIEEVGAHSLFGLRLFTSFIRHNTITHGSILQTLHRGTILEDRNDIVQKLSNFFAMAQIIKAGRPHVDIGEIKCPAVGYGDYRES